MSLLSFCLATYLYSGLCGLDSWLSFYRPCLVVLYLLYSFFSSVVFFHFIILVFISYLNPLSRFFKSFYCQSFISFLSFLFLWWSFVLRIIIFLFGFYILLFFVSFPILFLQSILSICFPFYPSTLFSYLSLSFSFFRGCRNKDINIFIYLLLLFLLLFIYYFLRYFPNFTVHS